MDTTGHLTCCEQAGDDLAVLVQDFGVGDDLQAAHGVVHACGDLDGIVGSGIQLVCKAGAAEVGVVLGLNIAVPGVHGLGQSGTVHADLLSQLLVGLALEGIALLDVALDDAGIIDHLLINDQPAVAAGLSDLSGGDNVTGTDFVNEALALGIDQHSTVAAQALGDQRSAVVLDSGVDLDLVHIHGVSTDGLCHLDALAQDARGVGGHKALQLGLVLNDHIHVCAETAGGQDHGLGVDGDGLTGSAGGLDANSSAVVIGQDLGGGGVQHHLDTSLLAVLLQQGHHVSAHRDVDGISAVGAQGLHQSRVIDTLAADHGIQLHQLNAVKVAGGVGLVGSPLLGHGSSQSGDGLVVSILFSSSLQGLFDTCALGKLVLILIHGLAGVHAAGSAHGVAAHHGLALHDDNALALAGGSQGSGHACAACTHDDDVGINGRVLSRLSVVLHSGLEILRLQTSSGNGSSGCLLDGIGGDGCGRHAVHGNAAALGNGSGQLLDCLGANALGLIGTLSGAAGDLAVGQGQGNSNIAAKALGSAGKIAGSTRAGGGGGLAAAAVAQQAHCNDSGHGQRCNALFHLRVFHGFFFFLLS